MVFTKFKIVSYKAPLERTQQTLLSITGIRYLRKVLKTRRRKRNNNNGPEIDRIAVSCRHEFFVQALPPYGITSVKDTSETECVASKTPLKQDQATFLTKLAIELRLKIYELYLGCPDRVVHLMSKGWERGITSQPCTQIHKRPVGCDYRCWGWWDPAHTVWRLPTGQSQGLLALPLTCRDMLVKLTTDLC